MRPHFSFFPFLSLSPCPCRVRVWAGLSLESVFPVAASPCGLFLHLQHLFLPWVLCWPLCSRVKGLSVKPCLRHLSLRACYFPFLLRGPPASPAHPQAPGCADWPLLSRRPPWVGRLLGSLQETQVRRSLPRRWSHARSVGS